MSDKPVLAYWDIRALAQPIRNLLHYAGVEFTDKRYPFGPGSSQQELDSIRQHWYKEKFTLGLDFPKRYPFGTGNNREELDNIKQHWTSRTFPIGLEVTSN